jgi:hypothetical protein
MQKQPDQKTRIDFVVDLSDIRYKDWEFQIGTDGDRHYLQVSFEADGDIQKGRKWFLSPHMTKSEVIQTALKAVLTAEEHEVREHFTYAGKAVFGPHIDVDALYEACTQVDIRKVG